MSYGSINTWKLIEKEYKPEKALLYDSLFSLGNGYMGSRGFHPEENKESYEAMVFIAGVYDYIKAGITDFVNTPNIFYINLYIDGQLLNPFECNIIDYDRELDMKNGVLYRKLTVRDSKERDTVIEYSRFFSLKEKHLAVTRYKVTPLNYSGEITVLNGIDAASSNNPIPDDQLKSDSEVVSLFDVTSINHYKKNSVSIGFNTKGTNIHMSEALCVVSPEGGVEHDSISLAKIVGIKSTKKVLKGSSIELDTYSAIYTSRDGIADIEKASKEMIADASLRGYRRVLRDSEEEWSLKWDISSIDIKGDDLLEQGLRYNIFQLISSNSQHDGTVSIGARGLTHSRYKGCYFWDTEIFMLPFYIYTCPEAAKNLLMFRYNTLKAAEENARNQNLSGARYPWMCNTDGIEQCETWDIGFSEVHITADIAYAIENYYNITGDIEFYLDYGAEILIQTARYWASRFTYDLRNDLYNMLFVKGPNEYGGVTLNNTYTTLLALYNLELGKKAIEMLKSNRRSKWIDMKSEMGFEESEINLWNDIITKAKVNYDEAKNLYIEDDNFYKLEVLDISAYKKGEEPLYKTICFDRLQRYRVIKQADVILLMCLLPDKFSKLEMKAAWDEYESITLHDSSLSYGTHAQFAAWLDYKEEAYSYLMKSIRLDIDNIMNNTGKEGIHFAAAGASWQAFIFGICGIYIRDHTLLAKPCLPDHIKDVQFKLIYNDRKYEIKIDNSHKPLKTNISTVD
ncbi:glycoside hydrolase family 65 protein [Alkaliphilus serpentinus]|uniref:Glycoside hydrolase family 65 protein n=1 Tax=Alkaliphilus serpentinus TaxID=1482731 RepID=A0A833HLL7_9FIRM|nr:glycoside hydrolase family 65 protein [Alkaliphilus serpentinus]